MSTPTDADLESAWLDLPGGERLLVGESCRIGRVEGNEIVNPDHRISRRHAVVHRDGDRFVLVDLGSTNGTFINDKRIFKPTVLEDGDLIGVGTATYTFHLPVQPASRDDHFEMDDRTIATVGRSACWMMVAMRSSAADREAEGWLRAARERVERSGAGLRSLEGAAFFAHWREGAIAPRTVRAVVLALTDIPAAQGASVALHYGAVRIGPAAIAGEENLLGADVTMTYKLQGAAAEAGVCIVLSPAAVGSLSLNDLAAPLETHAPTGAGALPPIFTIDSTRARGSRTD